MLAACAGDPRTSNSAYQPQGQVISVATFNVSLDGPSFGGENSSDALKEQLASGGNLRIRNIARIIQLVRPDVLLLNEFDHISDLEAGLGAFSKNYLKVSQQGTQPIDYRYLYTEQVNSGLVTDLDLDNNGVAGQLPGDAQGFGHYPGQYGMAILSRFPIELDKVRTFQRFLWRDMPEALRPGAGYGSDDNEGWYTDAEWSRLRLSSKSHWDVPIKVNNHRIHILASHPTSPVFDGAEDRNGKRNHDEIRFWRDYLQPETSRYIYDDTGKRGGLPAGSSFVIAGDLNASIVDGEARIEGIAGLLGHSLVNNFFKPVSRGGAENKPWLPHANTHTATWGIRSDYVLPSHHGLQVLSSGVFWPAMNEPDHDLVTSRHASSDHRLVWIRLLLKQP
jgi:hypothetical protein